MKKRAGRFPTLPCLMVTAILAVLLAIGFTMPFAAEAYPGGWSGFPDLENGPGLFKDDRPFDRDRIPIPVNKGNYKIKAGGWDCAGPCEGAGGYVLKDDQPFDRDRIPVKGNYKIKAGGYVLKDDVPFGLPRPDPEDQFGKPKIAGVKWGGGVSPKPPKSDDEIGPIKGPVPKTKAKIVMSGIDHHH